MLPQPQCSQPLIVAGERAARGPRTEARQFGLGEATFCLLFINKLQLLNSENKGD